MMRAASFRCHSETKPRMPAAINGVLAPPGPAHLADVKAAIGIAPSDTSDDAALVRIIAAVNEYIATLPIASGVKAPDAWGPRLTQAAVMLAQRLYRRAGSPSGVESFGPDGTAFYIQRNDPDIALLLDIGAYRPPQIG